MEVLPLADTIPTDPTEPEDRFSNLPVEVIVTQHAGHGDAWAVRFEGSWFSDFLGFATTFENGLGVLYGTFNSNDGLPSEPDDGESAPGYQSPIPFPNPVPPCEEDVGCLPPAPPPPFWSHGVLHLPDTHPIAVTCSH